VSGSRPIRLGIVSNPRSRQNLREMDAIRELLASHPEVLHRELHSRAGDAGAIRDLAEAGVEIVAISGGDGTVQGMLSEMINSGRFAELPRIAVLPSGMTNLIAHDVGLAGRPAQSLRRLIAAAAAGEDLPLVRRRIISMRHAAEAPPAHGFFLGTAAFYRGTLLGRDEVHRLGFEKSLAAGMSLFWFLLRALVGRSGADPLYRGEPMEVSLDGRRLPEPEQFLWLSTTLDRLILGLRPFWGDGEDGLRYTSIAFPPRRFGRALLPLLRGRPRPWMDGFGYRSGRVREVSLATDCPVVMDGEIFPVSRDVPVLLRADREIAFVRP
jgi:hypothetical protein